MPAGNKIELEQFNWKSPVLQEPYKDYQEYDVTTKRLMVNNTKAEEYSWNTFEERNHWTKQTLGKRQQSNMINTTTTTNLTIVHWLNIYNSSVLRRDGHVGFNDCKHYYLPGPTDWWAHFFHSTVVDMAALKRVELQKLGENDTTRQVA